VLGVVSLLYLCVFLSAKPDCGEKGAVWHELDAIQGQSNANDILKSLHDQEKKWANCAFEKDSTYARVLHLLGRYYWKSGDTEMGITFTRRAIAVNSFDSPAIARKELCNNYFNLGAMYAEKGQVVECLDAYNRSILSGEHFNEKQFIVSKAYKEIASVLFGQGDYDKAALASEKGFQVGRLLNDGALMSEALIENAQALIELGSLEEAEGALQAILSLNTGNSIHLGAVSSLFAEIRIRQKKEKEAIDYYQKAYEHYKKINFDYGCGQAQANLGAIYSDRLGDSRQAIIHYELALTFLHLPQGKAVVLNSIAKAKCKANQCREALKVNQEALSLFLPGSSSLNSYGNPSAVAIREVVDKAVLLSLIGQKGEILIELANKEKRETFLQSALATYMLADTMVDYMRWEHSGRAAKLFWREQTKGLYENAIGTAFQLEDFEKGFYFIEKSRAALLQDHLNELGASLLLGPREQEEERALKERVRTLQKQTEEVTQSAAARTVARNDLFDAQEKFNTFIRGIEKTNPAYYSYKYENRGLSITELRQTVLKSDQGYLAFFIGDRAAYGFYCDQSRVRLKQIDLDDYHATVHQFQRYLSSKSIQNKDFTGFLSASHAVYQLLIKPFDIPRETRLIISPDGQFIPFAAINQSDEVENFLIRSHPISYTYSASYLRKGARKKRQWYALNSFFGMAPVEFDPTLHQLPLRDSDVTLKQIDDHFVFSKCLEGKYATKAGFLQNMGSYPIVQLFTHASADTSISNNSVPGIYFADSVLNLTELHLPFQNTTELLVLSACETGVGVDQRGEGVFSLARGFAEAGIPSTLTTLWKVETHAIYDITQNFYRSLKEEMPLDKALQQAQLTWLGNNEQTGQLPYVWAGNVLIGNSDPLSLGISRLHLISFCVMLGALALIFVVLRKK
jgi:CHAT domain-containing protein/tetratricopeptide (TPR) repeat protein